MINVVDVTLHYGVRPVLRKINFRVETGDLVVLMGPNGMGKTSLLGVMAGVLSPQKGYVEINGQRRKHTEEAELAIRRQTVYLPDHPWLPANRTGREFLLAVGQLYGVEDDRLFSHVDRLLELFDLVPQADMPLRGCSAGQKKKLAICSVLVTEAPVMILDEPFSGGLDPSAILALRHVLKRLAQRTDVTVVMATPVPELVEELAEKVAVVKDGRIIAFDSVEGLRRMSGCTGSFAEVFERLIHPDTLKNIEKYFAP